MSNENFMATLNTAILAAAHVDGLLPKRLTKNQTLYLHATAQTANRIYWSIADAEQGLIDKDGTLITPASGEKLTNNPS